MASSDSETNKVWKVKMREKGKRDIENEG